MVQDLHDLLWRVAGGLGVPSDLLMFLCCSRGGSMGAPWLQDPLGSVLLDLQEVVLDLLGGLGGTVERSFVDLLGGPDGLSRGPGGSLGCPRIGSSQKWYQSILTASRNLVEWSLVKISKCILQQEK